MESFVAVESVVEDVITKRHLSQHIRLLIILRSNRWPCLIAKIVLGLQRLIHLRHDLIAVVADNFLQILGAVVVGSVGTLLNIFRYFARIFLE